MTKKSTCLYIITKSVWGGAAKYVYDLATHLSKDEFRVFIAAGGQGKFAQRIKKADIPYYQINNFQRTINPLRDFFVFFEILSLLFQLKPDIIHVNSSKAGGLVGLAARIASRKTRLIFTAHGWAFNEERPNWQISLIKIFSKLTALFYDKIICVSEYDYQIAIKNKIAPVKKLITIHNGIDIKAISFLPREQAQEKLLGRISPLVIGTIAEWTKNKGLFYLLEVIKGRALNVEPFAKGSTFKARPFDVILIGSGENPDKERLKQYIKKHNLKNIHLIEFIDRAASYLKAFDIFVLPSIKEGLPYTILEAMVAEIPIVATKVGGVPEMLSSNLVPSKNSQQLAEKILYLINNPEIAQGLAQKARKKVAEEFSLEKMLRKTRNIYFSNLPAKTS